MRAKECLSCDRFMPSATDCSHSEPSVSHVATGPIVLRRGSNPHYSKKTEHPTVKGRSGVADTMLEKRFCSGH